MESRTKLNNIDDGPVTCPRCNIKTFSFGCWCCGAKFFPLDLSHCNHTVKVNGKCCLCHEQVEPNIGQNYKEKENGTS